MSPFRRSPYSRPPGRFFFRPACHRPPTPSTSFLLSATRRRLRRSAFRRSSWMSMSIGRCRRARAVSRWRPLQRLVGALGVSPRGPDSSEAKVLNPDWRVTSTILTRVNPRLGVASPERRCLSVKVSAPVTRHRATNHSRLTLLSSSLNWSPQCYLVAPCPHYENGRVPVRAPESRFGLIVFAAGRPSDRRM